MLLMSFVSDLDTTLYPGKNVTVPRRKKGPSRGNIKGFCQQYCLLTDLKRSISADGTVFFACFASNWGQFFGYYVLNCCCPVLIISSSLLPELAYKYKGKTLSAVSCSATMYCAVLLPVSCCKLSLYCILPCCPVNEWLTHPSGKYTRVLKIYQYFNLTLST
jgi:hypothetical protein